MVKSVSKSFFENFCKKCPFFEKVENENPKGQVNLHDKAFTYCPVVWKEGYEELTPYMRRKLLKVFPKKVLEEQWRKRS